MTVSFPRIIPEAGVMQHGFEPQRVDYLSPETGARLGATTAGWPLWRFTASLNAMTVDNADIWRAWVAAQRGAQRLLFGCDYSRPIPKYHSDGTPFTAHPSSWSQTIDAAGNAVLTLGGVMPGVTLWLGDYIGFEWDTYKRSLVRVVEGSFAAADGTITITVEPPVHAVTPPSATVNLNRPTCLMRLVSGGTQLGDQMYGGMWTAAGGKVEAIQDLIP